MKEKINAIMKESEDENLEIPLYTDVIFKLDTLSIVFKNINIDWINKIKSKEDIIKQIFLLDWYMYGAYDKIMILENEFTIILKTQKKIELVRSN